MDIDITTMNVFLKLALYGLGGFCVGFCITAVLLIVTRS